MSTITLTKWSSLPTMAIGKFLDYLLSEVHEIPNRVDLRWVWQIWRIFPFIWALGGSDFSNLEPVIDVRIRVRPVWETRGDKAVDKYRQYVTSTFWPQHHRRESRTSCWRWRLALSLKISTIMFGSICYRNWILQPWRNSTLAELTATSWKITTSE